MEIGISFLEVGCLIQNLNMTKATQQTMEQVLEQKDHSTHASETSEFGSARTELSLQIMSSFCSKQGLEIKVVELSKSNFEQLVEMYEHFEPKRAAQGLPPAGRDRILSWLGHLQKSGENLVALYQDRVIGHTILCPVSPTRAEFAIFIDQEYRNQGIGTKFTEVTLEFAREKGYHRVWLSVEVNNLCAIRVYKKRGFRMRDLFGPEQEMEICFDKQE
jgi:RimJ/RimL family protein N-acetyltransferase